MYTLAFSRHLIVFYMLPKLQHEMNKILTRVETLTLCTFSLAVLLVLCLARVRLYLEQLDIVKNIDTNTEVEVSDKETKIYS